MAINPFDLAKLSVEEQQVADVVESHIDEKVQELFNADPSRTAFVFATKDLAKVTESGLTVKVREHVLTVYRDAKWTVEMDDKAGKVTLTRPSRKRAGRKPGTKNRAKTEPVAEPTPEQTPEPVNA